MRLSPMLSLPSFCILLFLSVCYTDSAAQNNTSWNTAPPIGIGTTAPHAPLEVTSLPLTFNQGDVSEMTRFSSSTGNYCQLRFFLYRHTATSDGLNGWTTASTRIQAFTDVDGQGYIDFNPANGSYGMAFGTDIRELMRITNAGNVLIGKTSQTNISYMLDVNGNARANKLVVNTTGADYVFAPAYRLRSLSALEKYIKANHHLPEITPARQMKELGMDIGDTQTRLLQKIEELTLYMIDQQKQIETLKEDNKNIKDLQVQVRELRALLKN